MINRDEFVKICTQAIHLTRKNVVAQNQKSGYKKFHHEIRENDYFNNSRFFNKRYFEQHGYSLKRAHDITEYIGMGNCRELAEYLAVEILSHLINRNIDANIRIVRSTEVDHVFLNIKLTLADECSPSLWEIDAWDPRIIDVSKRPDNTIKNKKLLDYGTKHFVRHSTTTTEYSQTESKKTFMFEFPKPKEGPALTCPTPNRELHKKHPWMYSDYTLNEAYENNVLDLEGEIKYPQKRSSWQAFGK